MRWQPRETAPKDRYVLLFASGGVRWDGNMEVGKLHDDGFFYACGGEFKYDPEDSMGHHDKIFPFWMELPPDPPGGAWQPIETAPKGRYVLICEAGEPRSEGNMEVAIRYHEEWWSCGGANGGSDIAGDFTHWMELPEDPVADGEQGK